MSALQELRISKAVAEAWQDTCLGCLEYDCTVQQADDAVWQLYRDEVEGRLKQALAETELSAMPNLGESRKACKAFGMNPGRYRISSEALYRRMRQDKELYRINSVVDVNNIISVETGLSLGSYDLDKISGGIELRIGKADECYAGIGKGSIPLCGIPLLADDLGPFGSPVSDSPRACISEETRHVLTVIYGFSGRDAAEAALKLAAERFTSLAGAEALSSRLVQASN